MVQRQVDRLDRACLDELYQGGASLAFDPLVLLKMVLYQLLQGNRSPAKWFEEAKLNEACSGSVEVTRLQDAPGICFEIASVMRSINSISNSSLAQSIWAWLPQK